jgi:beta-lactamase regulating signal transducer with metallopeptidase domain
MRLLFYLMHEDVFTLFALRTILQVTLVALLALLLVRTLAKRSPPARYGICLCALLCVLFSPVVNGLVSAAGWSVVRLPVLPASVVTPTAQRQALPVTPASPRASGMAPQSPLFAKAHIPGEAEALSHRNFHTPIPLLLLALWSGGAVFLLARLIRGQRQLATLRREMVPLNTEPFGEVLHDVQRALNLPRQPTVGISKHISIPLVLGFFRPLIALPEGLVERLERSQLRDVLIHEGAHIALRHPLGTVLQRCVGLLFWMHPLVHRLNDELAQAREEVCDNFVLQQNAAPRYARTLLFVAESAVAVRQPMTALGLLSPRWQLEERVAGLLDPKRTRATRACRGRMGAAITLLAMTGVGAAGVQMVEASDTEKRATVTAPRVENPTVRSGRSTTPLPAEVLSPLTLQREEEASADPAVLVLEPMVFLQLNHPRSPARKSPSLQSLLATPPNRAPLPVIHEDSCQNEEHEDAASEDEQPEEEEGEADAPPSEEEEPSSEAEQHALETAEHAAEKALLATAEIQRLQAEILRTLENLGQQVQEEPQEP